MAEGGMARRSPLSGSGTVQRSMDPRVAAQARVDPRVSMVLAVLAGQPVDEVARAWDVEPSLVHRWVRDFLVAGTAVVTNRPDPDAARQRDRFLAAFAHELRTPIAVAQGWAVMLADGDVPEEAVTDSISRLHDALTRLAERALDVELMATASLGRIRIVPERVEIADLCATLPGCTGARGEPDAVYADPRLLTRIVRDLWETAHRDPAPDSVQLQVTRSGPWQEVRVVREGMPIDAEVLQALLDPFEANDDATGVTTGLYLARALTVAHGGHLGAEGDDHSTVLWARLPREAEGPEPEPSGSATHEGDE